MVQEDRTKRTDGAGRYSDDRGRRTREREDDGLSEEVIFINRVAKVVKGGRKFGFSALVAVSGKIGLGIGKASEVLDAIRKGVEMAKKNMISIPLEGTTIPYEIKESFCATSVLIKPAKEGTGVIAGGPARTILKLAGIADVSAKYFGSNNRINCAKVAFNALKKLENRKALYNRRRRLEPLDAVLGKSKRSGRKSAVSKPVDGDVVPISVIEPEKHIDVPIAVDLPGGGE